MTVLQASKGTLNSLAKPRSFGNSFGASVNETLSSISRPRTFRDLFGNVASGGTVTDVTNYNGSGQTWRVHTFTTNGTLQIDANISIIATLLVGGGSNGSTAIGNCCTPTFRVGGNGGAGGKYLQDLTGTLSPGSKSVTIGASNGGNTVLDTLTTASGSTGGSAGSGGPGAGGVGGNGSVGITSTITGVSTEYSGGGGGGAHAKNAFTSGGTGAAGAGNGGYASVDCCALGAIQNGAAGAANRGAGGGGGSVSDQQYNCCGTGGAGGTGIAIAAYRIA